MSVPHPQRRDVLSALRAIVGPRGYVDDPAAMSPFLKEQRGRYVGRSPAVLRPEDTEQVSRILSVCAETGTAIVPQGGNTGLVGGSISDESGEQILLNLGRMNRVRAIDPLNFTMTVEAGCVLADLQRVADEAGLLFPLSLAAEGSCQIGGNLSTNAGGTAVLRYGNARELVLGLEVVLASGEIWHGLRGLRKDNTGYDVKQFFLGAEGTLGVITAAVLKLFPRPKDTRTVLVAVESPAAAVALLERCRGATSDAVTTFEYWSRVCMDLVLTQLPGMRDPLAERHGHYVLIELTSGRDDGTLDELVQSVLESAFEDGLVRDATVAESVAQAKLLWALREGIPEAQRLDGPGIKHDVSIPVSRVPEFLERGAEAIREVAPDVTLIAFGHIGDGNIHYNMNPGGPMEPEALRALEEAIHRAVYELVDDLDGSFSAEHGIGRIKREELLRYRSETEVSIMRAVKSALDPGGILNPGVVL